MEKKSSAENSTLKKGLVYISQSGLDHKMPAGTAITGYPLTYISCSNGVYTCTCAALEAEMRNRRPCG